MSESDFWLILAASLCNITCAILGCFLVLRRMSMIGDAITHAVLPGLAIAFFVTKTIDAGPMFVGALSFGVLTTVMTQYLGQSRYIQADAALGVVFTILFALGVLLIDLVTRGGSVHLDVNCVLEGELVYILFDTVTIAGVTMPSVIPWIGLILALTLLFVGVFWKELKISSFDPAYAQAQGFSVNIIHYGLMLLVASVAVAAFRLVGSILVVAMLIVPAATAQLVSSRMLTMLIVASTVGVASCIGGYYSAVALDTYVSGMISVCSGLLYLSVVIFAPGSGVLARLWQKWAFQLQIVEDDVLLTCYRIDERTGDPQTRISDSQLRELVNLKTSSQQFLYPWAIRWLLRNDFLFRHEDGVYSMTDAGRARGQNLIRAHRLWETYLDEEFALPRDHVHEAAERVEHYLNPPLQTDLAESIRSTGLDPQGKAIPPEAKPREN